MHTRQEWIQSLLNWSGPVSINHMCEECGISISNVPDDIITTGWGEEEVAINLGDKINVSDNKGKTIQLDSGYDLTPHLLYTEFYLGRNNDNE